MRQTIKRFLQSGLFASVIASGSLSLAQTKDGAILGGVAGAVIGGIVGHQNDETPEGALIGGAVGAIAGGMIGNHRQQQQQLRYYQQQPRYYAPQPQCYQHSHTTHVYQTPVYAAPVYTAPAYVSTVRPVQVRRSVTVADVIQLTRSGLSESVIANHIHANGIDHIPTTEDVLSLNDAGVSNFIINEMQRARLFSEMYASVPANAAPVVVREEVYTTPIDQPTRSSSYGTPTYRSSQLQPVPTYRRNF
jgi:hypothetical protein